MIAETNRGKICWPIPAGTNRNTGGINWSILTFLLETSRQMFKLGWGLEKQKEGGHRTFQLRLSGQISI